MPFGLKKLSDVVFKSLGTNVVKSKMAANTHSPALAILLVHC